MEFRTRFENADALADLPYFELEGGRLVLADDGTLSPSFDAHTHLALSYLRERTVDLQKSHRCTEHYLPVGSPLDLDVYANLNYSPELLSQLKRDLSAESFRDRGMRRTHTVPNLEREMADVGVAGAVLLPIDLPLISNNAKVYLEEAAKSDMLISLGSVHPFSRNVGDKLSAQKAMGARGLKVHPAVQMVAPDHPRAMVLYGLCADLDLPIFWHGGPVGIEGKRARRLCQLKHYWRAIHDHPRTKFVLGHAGALQMEMGLELAKSYDNVWLETASQSLSGVMKLVDEAPEDRLMHGSDWPFYYQAVSLVKVFMATEGKPEARRRVLWDNAARFFGVEGT